MRKSGPSVNPALPWSWVGPPPGPGLSCCLCSPSREAAVQGLRYPCCLAGGEMAMAGAGLCAIVSLSKDCES